MIRWVDRSFDIQDVIGMVHDITSATLATVIKDVLIRCVILLDLCRGQAYDGAASMIGHLSGVAKQLQSEQPFAIKVHCLAHSLKQDTAKKNVNQLKVLWRILSSHHS